MNDNSDGVRSRTGGGASTSSTILLADYRLVCRTCLAADVEFYEIGAPIITQEDNEDKETFLDCLRYCVQLDDIEELPTYICTECSSALQVAYQFLKNAKAAHKILCAEIERQKKLQQELHTHSRGQRRPGMKRPDVRSIRAYRYRCRACGEKLSSKRALKEHAKLHKDIIAYVCRLCSYECNERCLLTDHYNIIHGIEPSRDELKPKTVMTPDPTMKPINPAFLTQQPSKEKPKEPLPHLNMATVIAAASTNERETTTATNTPALSGNNMDGVSMGNEFIVLPDGSLQEVMSSGVVIEYINASATDDGVMGGQQFVEIAPQDETPMDIDDIIEEVKGGEEDTGQDLNSLQRQTKKQQPVPSSSNENSKPPKAQYIECKLCNFSFPDQDSLKSHMLSHNEIPHFFCDLCPFYTFFKVDMTQHYKSKHRIQPTLRQLAPKNKVSNNSNNNNREKQAKLIYACDLCLYETSSRLSLRGHYHNRHQVDATEVQLRPSLDEMDFNPTAPSTIEVRETANTTTQQISSKWKMQLQKGARQSGTSIRVSLLDRNIKRAVSNESNNRKRSRIISDNHKRLKARKSISSPKQTEPEQRKSISFDEPQERALQQVEIVTTSTNTLNRPQHNNNINLSNNNKSDNSSNSLGDLTASDIDIEALLAEVSQSSSNNNDTTTNIPMTTSINNSNIDNIMNTTPLATEGAIRNNIVVSSTTSTMTAIAIDNNSFPKTEVAAATTVGATPVFTIPANAVPQIVETETTSIPFQDMDFDFNNDVIFGDFDDDDNENDDEELLLTSDDDLEDMLQDQNIIVDGVQCVHCNKKFDSQYQFENHTFVHRGLAPYRCELCTNLYNTKRALIRHYKAVHKKIPTRDMIQAKGDKLPDKTPIEELQVEAQKVLTLMCAKCPYETSERQNLLLHLRASHAVDSEEYVLQKLPFECPRCIRSFASKARVMRHLERSHSNASILERQQQHQQHQQLQQKQQQSSAHSNQKTTNAIQQQEQEQLHQINATSGDVNNDDDDDTKPYIDIDIDSHAAENNGQDEHQPIQRQDEQNLALAPLNNMIVKEEFIECDNDDKALILDNAFGIRIDPALLNYQAKQQLKLQQQQAPNSNGNDAAHDVRMKVTPATYYCNACDYTCDRIQLLSDHSKIIHADEKWRNNYNFACYICKCKYKTIPLLKHHMKRHVARVYQCKKCPKSYINNHELANHQLCHEGALPHVCDMCPKKFRLAHHLKRHKDVAHYGKRVLCPVPNCGRQFTTLGQLKIHMWDHTGRIPYKCKFCEREFKKRELFRRHTEKVHKVIMTEDEIAEIYRKTVGYTNPHDFTIALATGQMLRRSELDTGVVVASPLRDNEKEDV